MGLIGAWLTLLHYGTPLAVMSPLAFLTRPERWLQAFHKHRGTITAAPNFAYELCVRKIADKDIEGVDLTLLARGVEWSRACESGDSRAVRGADSSHTVFGVLRNFPYTDSLRRSLAVTVPPLNRGPLVDRVYANIYSARQAVPADDVKLIRSRLFVWQPIPNHEVRIVDDQAKK